MNNFIFQEITPQSETVCRWNDITINAGASQSTLQDINLPECAGCFSYYSSGDLSSICSNRFIYWRSNYDIIELVEVSLDFTLRNNMVRLRFQNTPVLRGVSIHEHGDYVVLLVPTVSAIHKLVFPHPKRDEFYAQKKNVTVPSVFFDTSLVTVKNRCSNFVLNHVSLGNPLPHTSCSWLDNQGNATFVLVNSAGSILMMVMSDKNGLEITTTELMKTNSMMKLLNGLIPTAIRSSRNPVALDIVCHKDVHDTYIIAVFNDFELKVWSHKKKECVFSDSILNYDAEKKLNGGNFTVHQCHLRKSSVDEENCFYLGVYVPVSQSKKFYVFKPTLNNAESKLELVYVLQRTFNDLVDFCIAHDRIWTLWLTSENRPLVLSALLESDGNMEKHVQWIPASLENQVSRFIDYCKTDPQEVYLSEIFKVGRFSHSTITKAISTYNTSKKLNFNVSSSLNIEDLKKWVVDAVETEILLKTRDVDDEENLEVSADCWERFLSYCIQYHEVGMKPLGISADPNTGCVIMIKKNFYSLLCPCDPLEIVINSELQSLLSLDLLEDMDVKLYSSLKSVLKCIGLVRETVGAKYLSSFESKLLALECPIKYATEILKSLQMDTNNNFYKYMQSILPSSNDIIACIEYLLMHLDVSHPVKDVEESYCKYSSLGNSPCGIGILCAGLAHLGRQRFQFIRDLILFELMLYESDVMDSEQLEQSLQQSAVIHRTAYLVRSYFLIMWCTQRECTNVSPNVQEAAFKQFCLLELPEFTNSDLTAINQRQTISYLFFKEEGGSKVRKMLSASLPLNDNWQSLYPILISSASRLLWPMEGNILFPEFLYSHCQHVALQEYVNILQNWSTINKQFVNFLVGSSYLILGESEKAVKLFLEVSKEVERESLLCNKILKGHSAQGASIASVFCMKVIQMLEQFSLSESIVHLTRAVVSELNETDPHLPIFYSVLFKHHLTLGHSAEAFAVLIKNPDSSRQNDCLRQLVVKLCEMKQFQKIIELSYLAYGEEVVSILESRARCSDLCYNTSFYDILFSLHIHQKKFRKAACVMHELAMRFGREVATLKGLKKQASCYLAAINCLNLTEPQYAWIASPALSVSDNMEVDPKNVAKRGSDGTEITQTACRVKFDVLGLHDLTREYRLVQARLLHAKQSPNTASAIITPLSPEETVALLLNVSLFDAAIQLSQAFSLSLVPVFEAITFKCVSCSHIPRVNDMEQDQYMKPSDSVIDYSNQKGNLWNLLEKYILQYEKVGDSELHMCVAQKLLAHYRMSLPAWLVLSYQKKNLTELVGLYINYGLFEEALILLHKYVKAILGERKEDFDLKFSLHINSPAVWLPHTYIDIILDAARHLTDDDSFQEQYEEFLLTLKKYEEIVETITEAKLIQV